MKSSIPSEPHVVCPGDKSEDLVLSREYIEIEETNPSNLSLTLERHLELLQLKIQRDQVRYICQETNLELSWWWKEALTRRKSFLSLGGSSLSSDLLAPSRFEMIHETHLLTSFDEIFSTSSDKYVEDIIGYNNASWDETGTEEVRKSNLSSMKTDSQQKLIHNISETEGESLNSVEKETNDRTINDILSKVKPKNHKKRTSKLNNIHRLSDSMSEILQPGGALKESCEKEDVEYEYEEEKNDIFLNKQSSLFLNLDLPSAWMGHIRLPQDRDRSIIEKSLEPLNHPENFWTVPPLEDPPHRREMEALLWDVLLQPDDVENIRLLTKESYLNEVLKTGMYEGFRFDTAARVILAFQILIINRFLEDKKLEVSRSLLSETENKQCYVESEEKTIDQYGLTSLSPSSFNHDTFCQGGIPTEDEYKNDHGGDKTLNDMYSMDPKKSREVL